MRFSLLRDSLLRLVGCGLTVGLLGCPSPPITRFTPGSFITSGVWQWDSTTTPSQVYTPKTLGYSQQIALRVGTSVGFYRNDTLRIHLTEALDDSLHLMQTTDSSIVIKYRKPPIGYVQGAALYVRYLARATNKGAFLMLSDTLASYSPSTDKVHHYYHQVWPYPTLYPY